MWLILKSRVGFRKDLLETRASVELVSELDYCQIGMNAIVMGHDTAIYSDVHVDSSSIEVQRADALYDVFQMPSNADKSGSTLSGEFW